MKPKHKLMIACLTDDGFAVDQINRLAAAHKKTAAGTEYKWRNESACAIGRIETDAPNIHPVFCIGDPMPGLASFGPRNGCENDRCVLVISRNHEIIRGTHWSAADSAGEEYLIPSEPFLGFTRVVLLTRDENYRANHGFASVLSLSLRNKLGEFDAKKPEALFKREIVPVFPAPHTEDASATA